jgi:lipid-binding SYLF domain-containing protein
MTSRIFSLKTFFLAAVAALALVGLRPALAQNEALQADAAAALKHLYATSPSAKALGESAVGVLVFPSVTRLGFIVGAQGGDGILYQKGKIAGYYNTGAMSVGLQAGIQSYGYALFFMRDEDLKYLKSTKGWSIGTGPTIVIADAGAAKDVSTLTGQQGVYGFIFDQKGLMAGMALTGQKITKLKR